MQTRCGQCGQVVEHEEEPPRACPACGGLLTTPHGTTLPLAERTVASPARPASGHPADERPPEAVAGYRILRPLGHGGMGQVFAATEPSSGRAVALKLLSPRLADDREAIERFRQEGRLAAVISHPRCVFVYAADEEAGRPYIVMELMRGKTLQDLLSGDDVNPDDAVRKVLDVAEGLQEAHRLGVIHRDVKPSNCFVEPDGRVKIGDFGLSKSLSGDSRLTQTGAFVGTPLYASPEQVKGEPLDARTDVYSVCATLYALLTGRPPFFGPNPVAVLARIASETPPSARSLRPAVSAALDRVVMKGLERDREARWRDMHELRQALLPIVSPPPSGATVGLRFVAFLADAILLAVVTGVLSELLLSAFHWIAPPFLRPMLESLPALAYFGFLEGRWGATLGKWLLRLRVRDARGTETPGVTRGLARALVLYALVFLVNDVTDALTAGDAAWPAYFIALVEFMSVSVGTLLLVSTMRQGNGYRGLHELASGTRVLSVVRARRKGARTAAGDVRSEPAMRQSDLPETVGPYRVIGAYRWQEGSGILLAEDPSLGRRVVLRLGAEASSEARRAVARPSRLRWLGAGMRGDTKWEAYVAPTGRPLPRAIEVEGRLAWKETREVLDMLSEELTAARLDGTLPDVLAPDQVWVQPDRHVQVVDFPLSDRADLPPCADDPAPDRRALAMAYGAALTTLTGRPPTKDDPRLRRYASGLRVTQGEDGRHAGVCPRCLSEFRAREDEKVSCPACGRQVKLHGKGTEMGERVCGVLVALSIVWFGLSLLDILALPRYMAWFGILLIGLVSSSWGLRVRRTAERRPLFATVPLHAERILERLPGGMEPYADPAGLHQDLCATRDRFDHVDAWDRGKQVALSAALFFTTAVVVVILCVEMVASATDEIIRAHMSRLQRTLAAMDRGAPDRILATLAKEDPRRKTIESFLADPSGRQKAEEWLASARRLAGERLGRHVFQWSIDQLAPLMEGSIATVQGTQEATIDDLVGVASGAENETVLTRREPGWARTVARVFRGLWFCVLIWIACAMSAQGGIFLHLRGMGVVCSDGLPASPLRCGFRAILVWAPLCLAIATAGWLELRYPGLPWLTERVRYVGLTTLAVTLLSGGLYVAFALSSPERSPADVLAGTQIVPR